MKLAPENVSLRDDQVLVISGIENDRRSIGLTPKIVRAGRINSIRRAILSDRDCRPDPQPSAASVKE